VILKTLDGTVYKVHFRHYLPNETRRPATQCFIHQGDCRRFLDECLHERTPIVGIARCSPRDVFTKRLGRKIALGRALKNMLIDERVREQLMAAYEHLLLSRCPHRLNNGRPAWMLYEGCKVCMLCQLKRDTV
jgi:hypothetical protein